MFEALVYLLIGKKQSTYKINMESSQEIILIALGLLIVIFAGTLALRLGISLKD